MLADLLDNSLPLVYSNLQVCKTCPRSLLLLFIYTSFLTTSHIDKATTIQRKPITVPKANPGADTLLENQTLLLSDSDHCLECMLLGDFHKEKDILDNLELDVQGTYQQLSYHCSRFVVVAHTPRFSGDIPTVGLENPWNSWTGSSKILNSGRKNLGVCATWKVS